MNMFYVFIGGGLGSILRYVLSLFFMRLQLINLPWATFSANVLSCLVFGVTVYLMGEKSIIAPGSITRPLLLTGFCGGLSTFSAFSVETFELLKRGDYGIALLNILVSIALCLFIFFLFIGNKERAV